MPRFSLAYRGWASSGMTDSDPARPDGASSSAVSSRPTDTRTGRSRALVAPAMLAPGPARGVRRRQQLWDDSRPRTVTACSAAQSSRRAHPRAASDARLQLRSTRGAETWGIALDEVHLTRTDGKAGRREAGSSTIVGHLDEDDVEIVNGVRVTPAARCAVEVTARSPTVEPTLVVVNGLLHHGPDDDGRTRRRDRRSRSSWPDTLRPTWCCALRTHGSSPWRSRGRSTSVWHQQHPAARATGRGARRVRRLVGVVDFAWRELGVFVEFDGTHQVPVMRGRRDARGVPAAREAARGADLPAHRVGVHPHHVGGPREPGRDRSPHPQASWSRGRPTGEPDFWRRSCHFAGVATPPKRSGLPARCGDHRGSAPTTPERFSYGVERTMVVREETLAAARIRARRSSRAAGVATRTLRM